MEKLIWKVEIQHKFMKLLFKKASRFLTSALMTRKKNNCFDYCIEIECNNLKITKYTIQEFLCCKNQQITVQKNLRSISFEQTYDLIFRRCMAQNNWRTWHRYLNKYIISLFYHCTKQKFVKHIFKSHSISFLNDYSSSYNFEQHIYKTIKNKCSQSFITPSKTRVTNQEKNRKKKERKITNKISNRLFRLGHALQLIFAPSSRRQCTFPNCYVAHIAIYNKVAGKVLVAPRTKESAA